MESSNIQFAKKDALMDIPLHLSAYYHYTPDLNHQSQCVLFGTSGHRGNALQRSFNRTHIYAITQAIVNYRKKNNINGPVYVGMDNHALSRLVFYDVLCVLIANDCTVYIQQDNYYVPTPIISYSILHANCLSDGIIITPSHNPPEFGGIKYNLTHGGPANKTVTAIIEKEANLIIRKGLSDVKMITLEQVFASDYIKEMDLIEEYVKHLHRMIDIETLRTSKLKVAVHNLGGISGFVWQKIISYYDLKIDILDNDLDPAFRSLPLDHDGLIRMDCSSPYVSAHLTHYNAEYDLVFINDPDVDRFGVLENRQLLPTYMMLANAVDYLLEIRSCNDNIKIGKSLVMSDLIDEIAQAHGVDIYEVPVGFKWYAEPFSQSHLLFVGEESAGCNFLDRNMKPFAIDKDGIVINLLAWQMACDKQCQLSTYYQRLEKKHYASFYHREDLTLCDMMKKKVNDFVQSVVDMTHINNENIIEVRTRALGNHEEIKGVKIRLESAWIVIRNSGTEPLAKIYVESKKSMAHVEALISAMKQFIQV